MIHKYIYTFLIFIILSCSDYTFQRILKCGRYDSAKYFLNHFLANMVICYYCYEDVWYVIWDPIDAIKSTRNCDLVLSIIEGIHLYHTVIYFKKLTLIDWVHHLATFYMIGAAKMYHNGIVYNFGNFFLCGLPGGIDYLLLFLVKRGWMDKISEKYINTVLNAWIRNPGILFYSCILLTHSQLLAGHHFVLHCAALCFWNAIFFNNRVLINYGELKPMICTIQEDEVTIKDKN